eukprot:snap_masked-scaffold_3-processed-gene-11.11-mRNA-1 protein AED:1.00 eAED:1.00 QI:0/0/0/0/1/1/2/0/576
MLYFFNVIQPNHTDHEVKAVGNVKKYVQQLSAEELTFITTLGVAETSLSAAMVALHRAFPGILFSKELIRREMRKAKEKKSNSEHTNLVKLMNCGQKCIVRGGSFNLHFNHGSILTGVTFQEALQLKLSELYGESIQIDTTHGLTRYRLVAMFPVGVDCFLKTTNFGCTMMENENSNDVKRGLEELKLNKAQVVMSDGSLVLAKVAKSCGARHIRCLKHLAASFNEGAKGLRGSELVEFRKSLAEVITGSFPNVRALDEALEKMKQKFRSSVQEKYLKNLEKEKRSICWTYTKECLTFAHRATQRVESFHAKLKGKGMKENLKSWTLDDLIKHHETVVDLYLNTTLEKIKKLIKKNVKVSKEVEDLMLLELKLMHSCWIQQEPEPNKVRRTHLLTVKKMKNEVVPECTCATWQNHHLPCRHFARVCDKKREEFIAPSNLLRRWRNQDHPLYEVALRELGRLNKSGGKGIEFKVKVADIEMNAVPKSGDHKYSGLLAECKLLAEEAKHSDEGWRKVFATVRKMRRALQNNPDGNFAQLQRVSDDTVVTFESPRKRVRQSLPKEGLSPSRLDFTSLSP